eukprot:319523_1
MTETIEELKELTESTLEKLNKRNIDVIKYLNDLTNKYISKKNDSIDIVIIPKKQIITFGYIRNIENNYKLSNIIPTTIKQIIIDFYKIIPEKLSSKFTHYTIKNNSSNIDLFHRAIGIHAADMQIGMWHIDDKYGLPGIIKQFKKSKRGKHGYCKIWYNVEIPYLNKQSSFICSGNDLKYTAIMEEIQYLFSHLDGDECGEEDIICLDENCNEIRFKLSKQHNILLYTKICNIIAIGSKQMRNVYIKLLEGPARINGRYGNISIVQLVIDACIR